MRKSLTALTAATAIAAAAIATLTDARWRGGWWGPALGGFALGALFLAGHRAVVISTANKLGTQRGASGLLSAA